MTFRDALRLSALFASICSCASCSGSSGDRDGATSEAGAMADGGGSLLDGGAGAMDVAATDFDARPAVADALATPDVAADSAAPPADTRGGGNDAPAPGQEVGGQRDATTVLPPDAPVTRKDTGAITSTGDPTADRLAAAAAACGPQSRQTVPVGWQMVLAGEQGCAFYAPAGWQTIGAGTPMTFAVEDGTHVTGSSVMAGVDSTGTATCTPHGIATWMFANNKDCVGFKELYWKDSVDVVAGIQIPRGDLVYSCSQGGVPIVGYMTVQIHGTFPLCNLLAFAFWMPETQIESRTCTLTQTLNSISCPQGATGCDDAECRKDCIANGNQSGACTDDGYCICTND